VDGAYPTLKGAPAPRMVVMKSGVGAAR